MASSPPSARLRAAKRPRLVSELVRRERRRQPARNSEVVALYTASPPLEEPFRYHAFARCPPTALFGRPKLWPGPEGSVTTARLLWDRTALYVCWELEGPARAPVEPSALEAGVLEALQGGAVRPEQRSVLLDERVECFLWQPPPGKEDGSAPDEELGGEMYYAFEINLHGRVLTNRARFGGPMGFDWDSSGACSVWTEELAIGWGTDGGAQPKRVVIAAFHWRALGFELGRGLRVGLHRAEYPADLAWSAGQQVGKADVDQLLAEFVWTSWVDPGDDVVNFHRPSFFGKLVLAPEGADIDCSCDAARIQGNRALRVLPSPVPSLSECPPGSLLVKARYASLCGSDLPFFRKNESKGASCYWNRDGFCGHEVIGIVLESLSDKFKPGDAVLALPSSYFKQHASAKPDWYREEVHGVLVQSFPVRGAFCQIYTSHELYSCRIRQCVPHMVTAQGLGTVLKLARQIGPVLGKTVVVIGLGQNGLIATRLMAQMCARDVIAVEPLEYRRKLALVAGATAAVAPGKDAEAAVEEATDGRGADVVIEMAGHNQRTINDALELVACAGLVAAFGVPDDNVYETFEYGLFFRKNVKLIASVHPNPTVDFPEAVRLIEQGRFSTEGLITHTLPLSEIQRAFDMASDYTDGVVKCVVDLA